jgi:hypothetical protein
MPGMIRLGAPEIVAIGLVCVGLAAVLVLAFTVAVAVALLRRNRPSPQAREEALASIGYRRAGEAWAREVYGAKMFFEEKQGWRWSVRLPRYNTLTLAVEERASGLPMDGAFEAGHPDLDLRYVFGSERAAQTVALVRSRKVIEALLAIPWLSMALHADELVIADPELKGLATLTGGSTELGTKKSIPAEVAVHDAVATLVVALFETLYSKQTGTILPEFR